jgi:hypothetical protein
MNHSCSWRYVYRVHHPVSWLIPVGVVLSLTSFALLQVMVRRDEPREVSGLTWDARVSAANHRHPRLGWTLAACLTAAALAGTAYCVTIFV